MKDIGGDASRPETRLYTTSVAQPFHTDSADIVRCTAGAEAPAGCLAADAACVRCWQVVLLCLAQARAGGDSQVVSSAAIYNEARATFR